MSEFIEFILMCLTGLGGACALNLLVIAIEERNSFKWYRRLTKGSQ